MQTMGKFERILVAFCIGIVLILVYHLPKTVLTKISREDKNASVIANAHTNGGNHIKSTRKLINQHLSYNDAYTELEKNLQRTYTDDSELVGFLLKYWLVPPASRTHNQEENKSKYKGQAGQALAVDQILKGKTNGVYVESGAADGISSNTIFFEKFRNWTGVLIEPIPQLYNKLIVMERRAWHLNACLSSNNKIEKVDFANFEALSGNLETLNKWNSDLMKQNNIQKINVQCFPLHSVLAALNFTVIDYFSLDVEGAEMQVLRTIDFSRVEIKVFTIEYRDGQNTIPKLRELREFFSKHGYKEWGIVTEMDWKTGFPKDEEGLDVIFYKL